MSVRRQHRIRSFVRREGRFTPAQRRAFETLWARYGVDSGSSVLDLDAVFGRRAPCVVEIGFGNGESLATLALQNPGTSYLGIEVHRPGVGRLLNRIEREQIGNLRIICHDAVEVFQQQLAPGSVAGVNIFFPDPWPKKRHHKRRLVQPEFLQLLASRMQPDGFLHIATDWGNYAEYIRAVLDQCAAFSPAQPETDRLQTHFERRGLRLGHDVWDFYVRRTACAETNGLR